MDNLEENQTKIVYEKKQSRQRIAIPTRSSKEDVPVIKKQSSSNQNNFWGETKVTLETQVETDRKNYNDNNNDQIEDKTNNTFDDRNIKDNESIYSEASTISYSSVLDPKEREALENNVEIKLDNNDLSSILPVKSGIRRVMGSFVENNEDIVNKEDNDKAASSDMKNNILKSLTVLPSLKDQQINSDNRSRRESMGSRDSKDSRDSSKDSNEINKDNKQSLNKDLNKDPNKDSNKDPNKDFNKDDENMLKVLKSPEQNLIAELEDKFDEDVNMVQPRIHSKTVFINKNKLAQDKKTKKNEQDDKVENLDELFLLVNYKNYN